MTERGYSTGMVTIYDRIKKLRKERGFSQEELARAAGYTSRSSVSKIESGEVDISQTKVEAFAAALHTTPSYLMGWEDDTESANGYSYIDPEALDLMNEMRERPELQTMFSVSKNVKKEDIETVNKMLKALATENDNG
jgi:transcriptional regulator with XRE-family HTH domain